MSDRDYRDHPTRIPRDEFEEALMRRVLEHWIAQWTVDAAGRQLNVTLGSDDPTPDGEWTFHVHRRPFVGDAPALGAVRLTSPDGPDAPEWLGPRSPNPRALMLTGTARVIERQYPASAPFRAAVLWRLGGQSGLDRDPVVWSEGAVEPWLRLESPYGEIIETATTPRYTSAEVARALGVAPRTIRQHCERRPEIGALVTNRLRLYSDADLERLRTLVTGTVGRPRRAPPPTPEAHDA